MSKEVSKNARTERTTAVHWFTLRHHTHYYKRAYWASNNDRGNVRRTTTHTSAPQYRKMFAATKQTNLSYFRSSFGEVQFKKQYSRIYRTPLCTHKTSNNQTSKPAAA